MNPIEIPLDSDALRANLPGTTQPVVIPERYVPLIEAVQGYQGVKTPLTDTLAEYFHEHRNIDLLVDGFQTILLRNWTYFERSDGRSEAFALLSELILDLLDTPLSGQQASLLLRHRPPVAGRPGARHVVAGAGPRSSATARPRAGVLAALSVAPPAWIPPRG
jgi:hypothetical protein